MADKLLEVYDAPDGESTESVGEADDTEIRLVGKDGEFDGMP